MNAWKTGAVHILMAVLTLVPAHAAAPKKTSASKTKVAAKPWTPELYPDSSSSLPAKYDGTDAKKTYAHLNSRLKNATRGEFETTEEFEARTSNKEALIAPMNFGDMYAFSVKFIFQPKYSPDNQEYVITDGYSCRPPPKYGNMGEREWMICSVANIQHESDTYTGSNGFGVKKEINRTRGHDFAIALSTSKQGSDLNQYFGGSYVVYLKDRLPVPIEKAKSLKGKEIRALLVGRVTDARLMNGVKHAWSPKIDSPSDMYITDDAVPFDLRKIVYYVYETGEILAERPFP